MIPREINSHLTKLATQFPVVTVTGPRQSGKTTLVRASFPEKPYVNLELIDHREFAQTDPRGFLRRLPDGAVLDEIQRAPDLVSYIQGIVDEQQRNNLFILTGSQNFRISNTIRQSLAGRTAILTLLPFSYSEIQQTWPVTNIDELLYRGFFPRIYNQQLDPTQTLGDYFETYIERDLRQLVQVKNLAQFQKFVRLCAGRVGQLLNLSSLSRDIGISHTTAQEWLSLLQASYVIFLLEPFYFNIRKRLVKTPKLYFYDVGLASFLLRIENVKHLEAHPLRGHLFENWAILEILKFRYNQGKRNNLNFYRDSQGTEIDVIYNIAHQFLPVEIKAAETVVSDFFKGFASLEKIFPELPYGKMLIYGGSEAQQRRDVRVVPALQIQPALKNVD